MDKARSFLVGNRPSMAMQATSKREEWPTSAESYELVEECGRGVSATVWRAYCKPMDKEVAVKLLDLESINCSLEEIVKEAQTMRQQAHPNVLPLHCSFVHQRNLWMVMPYVAGGSVLNIMKYAYPEGLEEPVIATILKEVLRALDYMHRQGAIHRDVKAGNILIDSTGQVLLADFGVAATMERGGSWGNQQIARNTFVGTPCWMAPEVMEQTQGYNSLADIWSFGITILELAHGHAPFARLPPMKVLLMTIQNPPPTLESDSGKKHFSKAMRDIVAKCLVKDPTKRPSAAQLLEHKFFKTAHEPGYLVKHLLAGLPPLTDRVQIMRTGRAPAGHTIVENRDMAAQSQEAYVRGVSSWNFDVGALKSSALADGSQELPVIPEIPGTDANGGSSRSLHVDGSGQPVSGTTSPTSYPGTPIPTQPPSEIARSGSANVGPPLLDRITGSFERATPSLTPGKERPKMPVGVPAASAAGAAKPAHKKQGRFEVYEGDVPLSPPVGNGAALMDQHAASRGAMPELARPSMSGNESEAGTSKAEAEKAKEARRKGRFQIVEDDGEGKQRPPVPRTASQGGGGSIDGGRSGAFSPTGTSAPALLPPLREMLESMAAQHEQMKEVVAALQDSERGKPGSLASLLAQYAERHASKLLPHEKSEVAQLREENKGLREKLRVMEEELKRVFGHQE